MNTIISPLAQVAFHPFNTTEIPVYSANLQKRPIDDVFLSFFFFFLFFFSIAHKEKKRQETNRRVIGRALASKIVAITGRLTFEADTCVENIRRSRFEKRKKENRIGVAIIAWLRWY